VTVGQIIQIQVTASDMDPGQILNLTASGGLFEDFFSEKATFIPNSNTGVFSWVVKNEHVRAQPHQILFKVKDDFLGDGFAAFRIVRFHANATVGVQSENADLPRLNVFPNPHAGTFLVELPEPALPGMVFRIVSITGHQLWERPAEPGATTQTIYANDLPPGQYFLQVVSEHKVLVVEKFARF